LVAGAAVSGVSVGSTVSSVTAVDMSPGSAGDVGTNVSTVAIAVGVKVARNVGCAVGVGPELDITRKRTIAPTKATANRMAMPKTDTRTTEPRLPLSFSLSPVD
jgi:hypothetical protein